MKSGKQIRRTVRGIKEERKRGEVMGGKRKRKEDSEKEKESEQLKRKYEMSEEMINGKKITGMEEEEKLE